MKALTLWEPYASLIKDGHKRYETRSWSTAYRGVMVIHASVRFDNAQRYECERLAKQFLALADYYDRAFPLGCVVCAVELVDIHRTEDIRGELSLLELAVGNYGAKRFAWELEVVKVLDAPIPAKGQQGIWEWTYPTP